jgi:hypothetical protein
MIEIQVMHDHGVENPCEWDCSWTVYSFNTRHGIYRDPDTFDADEMESLAAKGLAFPLGYYEHGNCLWTLAGTGPSCPWDSVGFAGWIVWEGDESDIGGDAEQRRKDAAGFLDLYTRWCNGETYYISKVRRIPEDDTGEGSYEEDDDACCGGFIGMDDVLSFLHDHKPEYVGSNVRLLVEYAGDVTDLYLPWSATD